MKLILPALYHNDETKAKEDAGLDIENEEFDIRRVVFYQVSAIFQVVENGKNTNTKIYTSDTSAEIPMKFKEVEDLIDLAMAIGFVDGFKIWKEKTQHEAN